MNCAAWSFCVHGGVLCMLRKRDWGFDLFEIVTNIQIECLSQFSFKFSPIATNILYKIKVYYKTFLYIFIHVRTQITEEERTMYENIVG